MLQPYRITCAYTGGDLPSDATSTSGKCTVTTSGSDPSCAALNNKEWTILSGTSVTTGPIYTATCSPYTTAVTLEGTVTGSNSANTDPTHSGTVTSSGSTETATITNADVTTTEALTFQGPYRITCSFSALSYTGTAPNCIITDSASNTKTLAFDAAGTACTGGTCTVTSGPFFPQSSGSAFTSAQLPFTTQVTGAMVMTTTATTAAGQTDGLQTYSESGTQSISALSADTTTTNVLTNMGVSPKYYSE